MPPKKSTPAITIPLSGDAPMPTLEEVMARLTLIEEENKHLKAIIAQSKTNVVKVKKEVETDAPKGDKVLVVSPSTRGKTDYVSRWLAFEGNPDISAKVKNEGLVVDVATGGVRSKVKSVRCMGHKKATSTIPPLRCKNKIEVSTIDYFDPEASYVCHFHKDQLVRNYFCEVCDVLMGNQKQVEENKAGAFCPNCSRPYHHHCVVWDRDRSRNIRCRWIEFHFFPNFDIRTSSYRHLILTTILPLTNSSQWVVLGFIVGHSPRESVWFLITFTHFLTVSLLN